MKEDSFDAEVHPDPLPGDPEYQGHLAEIMTDASVVGSLTILQKNALRKTLLYAMSNIKEKDHSKHKGCSHVYRCE